MLSSKNKIFQSIIKSIQPEKDQGSNAEFVQTMADLNAKFSRTIEECHQWDIVRIHIRIVNKHLKILIFLYLEITTNLEVLAQFYRNRKGHIGLD